MGQLAVSDGFAWKSAAWKSCRMANNFPSVQNEAFVGWKNSWFFFHFVLLGVVVVDKTKEVKEYDVAHEIRWNWLNEEGKASEWNFHFCGFLGMNSGTFECGVNEREKSYHKTRAESRNIYVT